MVSRIAHHDSVMNQRNYTRSLYVADYLLTWPYQIMFAFFEGLFAIPFFSTRFF
jgi:hypothetical protein